MDRRLLFPAIAVTAWAQQVPQDAAEAEKAVRARAEKFLQLEQVKNYRAAWAFVADDTQDYFFNSGKPSINSFVIDRVELSDNNTRAKVIFRVKSVLRAPGMSDQEFEFPGFSTWKFENGDWYWYVEPFKETPFGKIGISGTTSTGSAPAARSVVPDLTKLDSQITINRQTVALTEAEPVQTIMVSNGMPGPIGLEVSSDKIAGVTVDVVKKQLNAGETGEVRFRLAGSSKASGIVRVICSPVDKEFDVQVTAN